MTKMGSRPICVVHLHEDGGFEYLLSGDAVFLVVDERASHDRVYQMTLQSPRGAITGLLGNSAIGSRHDTRHPAVRIALSGRSRARSSWRSTMTILDAWEPAMPR